MVFVWVMVFGASGAVAPKPSPGGKVDSKSPGRGILKTDEERRYVNISRQFVKMVRFETLYLLILVHI